MKNIYEKNIEIEYTNVDRNLNLSIVQTVDLIQNSITSFFETIGSDNVVIKEKDNAAWVVSKLKIHFKKYPKWKEKVKLTTYMVSQSKIRVEAETKAENEQNELLFVAKQETCPIDLNTRKIRKIDTISYPNDLILQNAILNEPYEKLNYKFEDIHKVGNREVYAIDTDYTHHTNNVKYVKFLANTLNSEFLDNKKITDLELQYKSESLEGQILDIYKYDEKDNIEFLIRHGEKEIIRAKLKYE